MLLRLLLLSTLIASGCTALPPQAVTPAAGPGLILRFPDDAGEALVWPPAPEAPRYRFIGQLLGEQNFPKQYQSLGRRFFNWMVGLGSKKLHPIVLQRPQSGFVDAAGRIYVTDVSRAAVYVFDAANSAPQIWEMAANGTRFITPIGIAAAKDDGILVADADLGRVIKLDRSGRPAGYFGDADLQRPTGLARDANHGLVYVADTQAHDVKVFDDSGRLLRTLGEHGELQGQFNAPTHLTVANGYLYVTDSLNSRVQQFDSAGNWVRSIGRRGLFVGDLPRPKGVAVDKSGNVYVVESYYDYLLVFNNKGEFLLPLGGTGGAVGQFFLPAGVWLDQNDRIYVADSFNGRVVIFQYLGET